MQRIGHTRPIGTTKRVRMFDWPDEWPEAELGMICADAPLELHRGYEVVGVEEIGRPGRVDLVLERLEWGDFLRRELVRGLAFTIVKRT